MNSDDIKLIEPAAICKHTYIEFINEYTASGAEHIHGIGGMSIENFEKSVRRELGYAKGIGLPEGCFSTSNRK